MESTLDLEYDPVAEHQFVGVGHCLTRRGSFLHAEHGVGAQALVEDLHDVR